MVSRFRFHSLLKYEEVRQGLIDFGKIKYSTPVRFEVTHTLYTALAGQRLNHSAKVPYSTQVLDIWAQVYLIKRFISRLIFHRLPKSGPEQQGKPASRSTCGGQVCTAFAIIDKIKRRISLDGSHTEGTSNKGSEPWR